jgi:hypothetical protein
MLWLIIRPYIPLVISAGMTLFAYDDMRKRKLGLMWFDILCAAVWIYVGWRENNKRLAEKK